MKKRILSMLLMLTMVFSLIVVPNATVASAVTYYDTVDTDCELAVDVLSALGIMGGYTDGSFLPYNPITRAEMVSVAVKLAGIDGYSDEAPDDMELFNDMYDYDGWAAGVIAIAKAAGIARSDENGNFNPDMSATYEEALQMVVSALGYGHQAYSRGDTLNDYVYVAQRLGLTKGLSTGIGQNITRADVAKVVYKALTVDLMEPVSYSGDGTVVTYEAVAGKNALNTYFDVYEVKGIITENEYAAIDGDTTVEEKQVLINGEAFNVGATDVASYLGYYASVYALENDDSTENRTVIAYSVKSVKNNTLTIDAEMIENINASVDGYTFEYWKNPETDKKVSEVETSSTPLVMYNGKSVIDVTKTLLKPDNGHVVLIDNNGDDEYDIIDVWEYDLVYVFAVSTTSGNVTGYYDRSHTYRFDAENEDYHVTFLNTYGGIAKINDIKQYSVLYVYESVDGTEKKVVISNNMINGTIDEISSDGHYTISGTEYEISPAAEGIVELAVSDTGKFYLDADNRIAGFEGTTVIRKNIGMFIAVNDGGLERGYQMKLLTANSGVQIYNIANSVKVNGVRMSAEEIYDSAFTEELFGLSPDSNYSNANIKRPHPAKAGFLYKLDSDGEICEMVVVGGNNDGYLQTRQIGKFQRDSKTLLYYSKNYGCLHYSEEVTTDEFGNSVGVRTYCEDSTITFLVEEADYKTENQSFYTKYMTAYWDNYQFSPYDWTYAYYYSEDGSPVDMQKTVCNFLVMADWYAQSSESTEDTSKNTYATYHQPDVAPKFIHKITEAYDKSAEAKTVRVYYYDGTSLRNMLVRPQYYEKDHEGHVDHDPSKPFLPSGFPVRISTDGQYIEDIAPFYDSLYFDMYKAVEPIFNESTSSFVTPFMPFYQEQKRTWNSWDNSNYPYSVRHYCGIVTSIDEVVNNKLFSVACALSEYADEDGMGYETYMLSNERLEGTVYRVNYDRTGNISGITRASLEDIVPGQFVIVRKRAYATGNDANWQALTGYAVNEFFILSDSAEELDYLKDFYDQVQEEEAERNN